MSVKNIITILVIIIFAFVLRFITLNKSLEMGQHMLVEEDSITYEDPAKAFLLFGRFTEGIDRPDEPMLVRTPGYPLVIAAVYSVFGEHREAVLILQVILNCFVVLFIYLMGRCLWEHTIGLYSALFVAISHTQIYYSTVLLSESIFTFFIIGMCMSGVFLIKKSEKKIKYTLILGVCLALATLVRSLSYYLIIFIPIGIFLFRKEIFNSKSTLFLSIALTIIPTITLMGIWQVHNKEVFGEYVMSGIQGQNMLYYRAAPALAYSKDISWDEASTELTKQLNITTEMSSGKISQEKTKLGIKIILENPISYMKVALLGMSRMILGYGESPALRILGDPSLTSGPYQDVNKHTIDWVIGKWFGSRIYQLLFLVLLVIFLFIQYVTFSYGVIKSFNNKSINQSAHVFLCGVIVYFIIISSGTETYSRFRVPIDPIIMLYSGYGFFFSRKKIRSYNGHSNNTND